MLNSILCLPYLTLPAPLVLIFYVFSVIFLCVYVMCVLSIALTTIEPNTQRGEFSVLYYDFSYLWIMISLKRGTVLCSLFTQLQQLA